MCECYLRALREWLLTDTQEVRSSCLSLEQNLLRLTQVLSVILVQPFRFNTSMFLQFWANVLGNSRTAEKENGNYSLFWINKNQLTESSTGPWEVVVQLLYVSIFSSPKSSLYFLRQLVIKVIFRWSYINEHTKKYNSLKQNYTTIVFVLFAWGHSEVRFNRIFKKKIKHRFPWDWSGTSCLNFKHNHM